MLIPICLLASIALASYEHDQAITLSSPVLASAVDPALALALQEPAPPPPQVDPEDRLKWTYVDLSYLFIDVDFPYTEDPETVTAGGSFGFLKYFNVIAGYGYSWGGEIQDVPVYMNSYNIGGGAHFPVTDRFSIFGTGSYVWTETTAPGFNTSVDADGFQVGGGVRYLPVDQFEAAAEFNYIDLDDADDTSYALSAIWHLHEHFGLRGGVAYSDADGSSEESWTWLAGLRWQL